MSSQKYKKKQIFVLEVLWLLRLLKLYTMGQLLWLLCSPAEREPILTSQTYCLFLRMTRECGNSMGHIVFI